MTPEERKAEEAVRPFINQNTKEAVEHVKWRNDLDKQTPYELVTDTSRPI
jgi:hypothetical protein